MKQIDELQTIPGVGPRIAKNLQSLGIHTIHDLQGKNPETLYQSLMKREGHHIDRCVLYVFRCAVYFASEKRHDPELLAWWHWKD